MIFINRRLFRWCLPAAGLAALLATQTASAQTAPQLLMAYSAEQLVTPLTGTWELTGPTTGMDTWIPGTIRVFTSEWALRYRLSQGWRGTALLVLEKWSHTPLAEQEHPDYYFRKAYQVARNYGIRLISSPAPDLWGGKAWRYINNIQNFTANALAIQPQIWGIGGQNGTDAKLKWVVHSAVADNASREAVYGGLSTCAGGWPRTSSQLQQSYLDTRLYGVTHIWLNVPKSAPQAWDGGPGCPDGNPVPAQDLITYVQTH